MPHYVVRIDLYKATARDNERLTEAMRQRGFVRIAGDGQPLKGKGAGSAYFVGSAPDIEQAFHNARGAARQAFKGFSTGTFFNVACSQAISRAS